MSPPTPLRLVVFSRDRAAQCDLLLRSLSEMTPPNAVRSSVFYSATQSHFRAGYELAMNRHPNVDFRLENRELSLKDQIAALIVEVHAQYFSFLVDDLVIVRPFGPEDRPFQSLAENPRLTSLSLRLHPGVSYSQPLAMPTLPPRLSDDLTWRWKPSSFAALRWLQPRVQGDWSLPLNLDGNVYRYSQFLQYFAALPEFERVPALEGVMSTRDLGGDRMICYPECRTINLALNRVDPGSSWPCGDESSADFNERFLGGREIAIEPLKNFSAISCHAVVTLTWQPSKWTRRKRA